MQLYACFLIIHIFYTCCTAILMEDMETAEIALEIIYKDKGAQETEFATADCCFEYIHQATCQHVNTISFGEQQQKYGIILHQIKLPAQSETSYILPCPACDHCSFLMVLGLGPCDDAAAGD